MKKLTIFLGVLLLSMQAADAQLTKGNWLVGGNGYFSTQSQKQPGANAKGSNLRLSPNIGYFLADKFAAGARLNFEHNTLKYSFVSQKSTRIGIGPFLRYYLLDVDKKVNVFTEGSYQYSYVSSNTNSNTSSSESDNTFRVSAGPVFYFNSSVGLELSLNYELYKTAATDSEIKKFFIGIGFQIHLEKDKN